MIAVTDVTKTAYLTDSIPKTITIYLPDLDMTFVNGNVVGESLEIVESIETEDNLSFRGCNASQLKFKVAEVFTDLRGQRITVTIDAGGNTDPIPLFMGIVDTQDNLTHEDVVTEIIAYDILYIAGQEDMSSWYKSLTFPKTIKQFRDAFFTEINTRLVSAGITWGISQEDKTLVNDTVNLSKVTTDSQWTAQNLMRYICQLNGVYGQLGRDGKFYYRELNTITKGLYPSTTTYPSNTTYPSRENSQIKLEKQNYITAKYEPYDTEKINKVVVLKKDGTQGGTYGSGTNVFVVQDNMLAYGIASGTLNTVAQRIYNKVKDIWYKPSSVDTVGIPWIECGDIFMFNTRKNVVRAYVLNRTLRGIQALYDTYEANGSMLRDAYKETQKTKSSSQETKTQENTATITQQGTTIGQQGQTLSSHTNTLNDHTTRIGNIEADYVKTNQLDAYMITSTYIQGGVIKAGYLDASTIRTKFLTACSVSPLEGQLDIGTARLGTLQIYKDGYKTINLNTRTINGVAINLLEWY